MNNLGLQLDFLKVTKFDFQNLAFQFKSPVCSGVNYDLSQDIVKLII